MYDKTIIVRSIRAGKKELVEHFNYLARIILDLVQYQLQNIVLSEAALILGQVLHAFCTEELNRN